MKKLLMFFLCAIFLVFGLSQNALAVPIWGSDASAELTGSRTSPAASGISATGDWDNGGLELSWNIFQSDGLWTYEYTLTVERKAISHFILEVTQDDNPFNIFAGSDTVVGPQIWSGGPGNPGMPNDIYGVKFDFGAETITYVLITDRAPVYGVFYAKDGKTGGPTGIDIVAWSNALNFGDYKTNESLTTTDFIVRPNGMSVPEPTTMLLLVSGLVGLVGFRKRSKKV